MAFQPSGRYAALRDPTAEEYNFSDLSDQNRRSSYPASSIYTPSSVYSQTPTAQTYRDVPTAYGGPGSGEYIPQIQSPYNKSERPPLAGPSWSGYSNDERAFNELPPDVQGIHTRLSWIKRVFLNSNVYELLTYKTNMQRLKNPAIQILSVELLIGQNN